MLNEDEDEDGSQRILGFCLAFTLPVSHSARAFYSHLFLKRKIMGLEDDD
jgi:hypothetical protein